VILSRCKGKVNFFLFADFLLIAFLFALLSIFKRQDIFEPFCEVPPEHLLLDSAPNLGPLIYRWEINKFENCWYKSVRSLEVVKLSFQQILNLSSSQRDMSGPMLGNLSNNRWLGVLLVKAKMRWECVCDTVCFCKRAKANANAKINNALVHYHPCHLDIHSTKIRHFLIFLWKQSSDQINFRHNFGCRVVCPCWTCVHPRGVG
jgi:hypothetical protein